MYYAGHGRFMAFVKASETNAVWGPLGSTVSVRDGEVDTGGTVKDNLYTGGVVGAGFGALKGTLDEVKVPAGSEPLKLRQRLGLWRKLPAKERLLGAGAGALVSGVGGAAMGGVLGAIDAKILKAMDRPQGFEATVPIVGMSLLRGPQAGFDKGVHMIAGRLVPRPSREEG